MATRSPSCPYCSAPAQLVAGEVIYPHRPEHADKLFWSCRPCRAYVGVHEGTTKPLGRLANAELRRERVRAHKHFDELWRKGGIDRDEAYGMLANHLGIPRAACHIGRFDTAQCRLVVQVCVELAAAAKKESA